MNLKRSVAYNSLSNALIDTGLKYLSTMIFENGLSCMPECCDTAKEWRMKCDSTERLGAMCFGEFLGTFLLVLFGTGTVAVAILFQAHTGLWQVATAWGVGVTLAIYATRHLSCAHLNPAVSLGMVLVGRMRMKLLPWYWAAQLLGGIAAGGMVLLLFQGQIAQYEAAHQIVRGSGDSVRTAMMFGEYFPNPGFAGSELGVSMGAAMLGEALGTFLLVAMVFALTEGCNVGRPSDGIAPVFIGATVTAIITFIAPLTQAGINPARDFGPRLVSYLAGWGSVAIPGPRGGFFLVYILAPLVGGACAGACFRFVIAPFMLGRPQPSPAASGQEIPVDAKAAGCATAAPRAEAEREACVR